MSRDQKKRSKLTNRSRVVLATASLLSFVGGWNLIGRIDNELEQAQPSATPLSGSGVPNVSASPTLWPPVPPLVDIPPVPTLLPALTISGQVEAALSQAGAPDRTTFQMAPLPTPISLPTLAPLPELPAPPPLPPSPPGWASGGNHSGGS